MKKNISLIFLTGLITLLGINHSAWGFDGEETTIYSGAATSISECECCPRTTWDCPPPFSGGDCDEATCGRLIGLNSISHFARTAGAILNIHSQGPVSLTIWWARRAGHPYIGNTSLSLPAGDYQVQASDIGNDFLSVGPNLGGIIIDWQACGQAYITSDFFYDVSSRDQRSNRPTSLLCPAESARNSDCPCTEPQLVDFIVPGCYEIPVLEGTYIRASFFNPSWTEWQSVWIEGVGNIYIEPNFQGDPHVRVVGFTPRANKKLNICIGQEDPFSGGRDFSDVCLYAAFEQVINRTDQSLTLSPRQKIVMTP